MYNAHSCYDAPPGVPRLTGKERDAETGLDYFGARYYSNGLGRWVSADWSATPVPVPYADFGDPQSLNLYGYVRSIPTTRADADGHCGEPITCGAEIGAGIGTAVEPGGGTAVGATIGAVVGIVIDAGLGIYAAYKYFHNRNSNNVPPPPPPGNTGSSAHATSPPPPGQQGNNKGHKDANEKTHQTYTKSKNGQIYSGRTSGTGTPEENVAARDANHHMNQQGYGPAQLDQSSENAAAIRGREQILIEQNGGAQSQGGTSGNAINGVSPNNPNADTFRSAAEKEFPSPDIKGPK
jgi:RHS repeat-associated protein